MLIKLAFKSLISRKSSVLLAISSITIGIMLLISMHFIKNQAKSSFSKTISGIDLIVGTKNSDVNLLLYSVFHISSPVGNIDWAQYESINNNKLVDWSLPISLGDSHRGFRVIGTNKDYFNLFQYGDKKNLKMTSGHWFNHPFDVVIGSDVASKLQYSTGDAITLSHGISQSSFTHHDQFQFRISGILNVTGTPVDRSLFVSLSGLEAIHMNLPKNPKDRERFLKYITDHGITPKSITAIYVKLKNKSSTFIYQRKINNEKGASLHAVLPGVALAKLWNMTHIFERILLLVGILVFISTIIGLVNILISSLLSRKKELALLRIIGASPVYCFLLIQTEAILIILSAMLLAILLCWILFLFSADWLATQYGFFIQLNGYFSSEILLIFALILISSLLLICIPAIMFYKQSMIKCLD